MPRLRAGLAAAMALLLPVAGACSRRAPDPASPGPDGGVAVASRAPALAAAPAASAPATVPAPARGELDPARDATTAPAGEARRTTLARLEGDPLLLPQLGTLRDHFGAAARGPFEEQRVELAGGRTAALVARADDVDPIVVVLDRDALLWSKLRPAAGIVPPVHHLALVARPDGGAGIFAWVAALHVVAARMWGDDGNPFGDFELFAPDACDALSAAYGPGTPGLGWVVVCTSRARAAGMRAQRMREDGTIAWPHEGVALGAASATGPATVVFDSPSTFVVLAQTAAVGGDRVLAYRYDANGEPLWAAPVDLGAASPSRVEATAVGDGVVRVALPRGARELRSDGELRLSPP